MTDELNRLRRSGDVDDKVIFNFVGHVTRPMNLTGYGNYPFSFLSTLHVDLSFFSRARQHSRPWSRTPPPTTARHPPRPSPSSADSNFGAHQFQLRLPDSGTPRWSSDFGAPRWLPDFGAPWLRLWPPDSGRLTPSSDCGAPRLWLWPPDSNAPRRPGPPPSFEFMVSTPAQCCWEIVKCYTKMLVLILIEWVWMISEIILGSLNERVWMYLVN
jgi:hypothetical protein